MQTGIFFVHKVMHIFICTISARLQSHHKKNISRRGRYFFFDKASDYSAATGSADKMSNSCLVASPALMLLQMAYSFASRSRACS